jgi:hypothetical protein
VIRLQVGLACDRAYPVNLAKGESHATLRRQAGRRCGSLGATGRGQQAGKHRGCRSVGRFTSDLSVSEYVLLGEAGFEPFGFVVGFTGMGHGRVFSVVSGTGCS